MIKRRGKSKKKDDQTQRTIQHDSVMLQTCGRQRYENGEEKINLFSTRGDSVGIVRTIIATQELVVPKSIPITSPASEDFQRRNPSIDDNGVARLLLWTLAAAKAVRRMLEAAIMMMQKRFCRNFR